MRFLCRQAFCIFAASIIGLASTQSVAELYEPVNLAGLSGAGGFSIRGIEKVEGVFLSPVFPRISVGASGDINSDGFDDLVIGAPGAGELAGASYLVYGSSARFDPTFDLSALNGNNGFTFEGDVNDFLGGSVSGAGDVNGDGIPDLIVGAPFSGSNNVGRSFVIFGGAVTGESRLKPSTLDGDNGFIIEGVDEEGFSAISVSGAGDMNGDGFDDVIIGAYLLSPDGRETAGKSYVVFGSGDNPEAKLELSQLDGENGFEIAGIEEGYEWPSSVSQAGDINSDGFDDVIIGAPFVAVGTGASYVVFGKAGAFDAVLELSELNGSNGFVMPGTAPGDLTGWSVSGARDVNGDGIDDVIIGAPNATPEDDGTYTSRLDAGQCYVVFGRTSGFGATLELAELDGSNGFLLAGVGTSNATGWSVGGAGDVNGDGIDDLVIGAPFGVITGPGAGLRPFGKSYVVFGRADSPDSKLQLANLDASRGFVVNGVERGNSLGEAVSGIGDMNGDGFDDLLIGSLSEAFVIFGQNFSEEARRAFSVTTLEDEDDGELGQGNGDSLREVIAAANETPASATILFAEDIFGVVFLLNGKPLPEISADLVIQGPGLEQIAVEANHRSRIFSIRDTAIPQDVVRLPFGQG